MNHCGEEYRKPTIIYDLLSFINSNFNAATLAYFMTQNVVIFIDTQPEMNAERMLKRGTGGDSTRARIKYYPHAQALAYYTVARLFGWKVFCVPYKYAVNCNNDVVAQFNPEGYKSIAEKINTLFNKPNNTYNDDKMLVDKFNKPSNAYIIDHTYSKCVGIHK